MAGATSSGAIRGPATVLRFDRAEAGGAVGDLGTFLPLLIGMVSRCGLHLGHALLFAGVAGVITGLAFGIPMPIQPMKAIAAVAIAEGMGVPEILAAGIVTGAVLLALGVTGLIDWLDRVIPRVLVRAIQLALGLKLLYKGLALAVESGAWIAGDSIALAIAGFALVFWLRSSRRVPAALAVCALGLGALLLSQPHLLGSLRLGLELPTWHGISKSQWLSGLWRGAVPQIPLTVLNAVIAVSALSADLFPERRAAPKKVAISVGLLNLVFCPFGAMPMCHGAGGLAAHYRFGGRTGGCVVILGVANIALALLFGSSLVLLLSHYPLSILGVLLVFAGLELVLVCRDQRRPRDIAVMLVTAAACFFTNTAAGFALGLVVVGLLWAREWFSAGRQQGPEPERK